MPLETPCCPMYPNCTGEFYELHYCQGVWSPKAQAELDACTTEANLRGAWKRLERAGEVDLIYGAEWHHALAHLRYVQSRHAAGEPS